MNNNPMQALAQVMTEKFIAAAPQAAAGALSALATHEIILLIGGLKAQTIIAVLNPMDPPKAAAVLRRLPLKQASYVLTHLDVPQAAKLWKEFAIPYQERLKSVLPASFVELLQSAVGFEPGSVGCAMQTTFVSVRTETKIIELVGRLKILPRKKLPALCFVTDKNGVLKGVIPSAELAFFNPQALCGSVMSQIKTVRPQENVTHVQSIFEQESTVLLPVVNDAGILVGTLEKGVFPAAVTKKSFWQKLTH